LTTDGVTEAANEGDEEFGAERVTASARAARSLGAQGIRTRILEDVSRFCKGNFQDDASLIVVTVDWGGVTTEPERVNVYDPPGPVPRSDPAAIRRRLDLDHGVHRPILCPRRKDVQRAQ